MFKNPMSHICYLTNTFRRNDPLIFERQGKSMAIAGYRVTYIVSDFKLNEVLDGIEIVFSGFQPENRLERFALNKRRLLRRALEINADVYQISEPGLISVGLKLIRKEKKVVFNLRENYPASILGKDYIPLFLRKFTSILVEKYMMVNLRKFDAIFTVTDDLSIIVEKKWKIRNPITIANYPIPNKRFKLSYRDYLARPNNICYVGSIYAISRQEVILEALEDLPEVNYLVAGKIEEGYEIDKSVSWCRVEFIDGFVKSELKGIFSKSILSNTLRDFSMTGTPNGSSGVIKIFESMEAGLPILCSNVKLYRELIDEHNCGIYVDPNNVNEVNQAIKFIVNNKRAAYEMGQNGRRAVLSTFNWESQFVKYEEKIGEILTKK